MLRTLGYILVPSFVAWLGLLMLASWVFGILLLGVLGLVVYKARRKEDYIHETRVFSSEALDKVVKDRRRD